MQLFAIVAKQDEGVESNEKEYVLNFLTQQLSDEAAQEYFALFEKHAGLADEDENGEEKKRESKLTSVKDSVRILGICKKINKTLTQNQKIVALVRLFELVNADRKFSDQRMAIINTVAEVFKVDPVEFRSIETFIIRNEPEEIEDSNVLVINDKDLSCNQCKHISTEKLDTNLFILRINSVDLYFLKYTGHEDLFLNGLPINNRRIYLFANGSTVKLPKGKPIYYSDVASHFLADLTESRISYQVNNIEYQFANGNIGLQNISFAENQGKLIGIMGASGAGKTTLLNVLCGNERPSQGNVLINGIDLHNQKDQIEGVIGLIPQDDLLIEELTVFENLYYNAKFCFKDKSEEELVKMVDKTLANLGLLDRKNLKVGSPLNKTISGGQRKRLNIALELIREPSILFVDEPTSGLSSRDSENVMDLLRELTLKGKLIFVVIHQPSSDIYKMFDKMIILDTGGYLVYYGNPVEAVMYFKRLDAQINSDVGECPTCGNVNPELIFNIIEARVVDEFGNYTDNRKVIPVKWEEHYKEQIKPEKVETISDPPPGTLNIPNWFSQFWIYTSRDFFSKISNRQYIALNLLEAPVLGFILSYIIRYIADPKSDVYIFRENENIHIYIFMAIIVSLFLGLTVSAEEIFRDRKILKREAFLNLSRSGYLSSKILILFSISAIQSVSFIIIANTILGIRDMGFAYWFTLFSVAAFANMLGLNVSQSFNSAVTIYILIPLLMIPMMILSGAMFSFDKLNRQISSVDKVPWIAEVMVTKWAYEALLVHQFKENKYERHIFELEKGQSIGDFKTVHYLPALNSKLDEARMEFMEKNRIDETSDQIRLLQNEIIKERQFSPQVEFTRPETLTPENFDLDMANKVQEHLQNLEEYYSEMYHDATTEIEKWKTHWMEKDPDLFKSLFDACHNESVTDIAKNVFEKNYMVEYNNELVQQIHPIFHDPVVRGPLDFRAHFLAPRKHFAGKYFDTYWFNMLVIWLLTIMLYVTLYYQHLKKLLEISQNFKPKK